VIIQTLPRERNASKLSRDSGFRSFQFFLRSWPSLFLFKGVIEQNFAPAAFTAVRESLARQFAL
jgi:hypothetical protein